MNTAPERPLAKKLAEYRLLRAAYKLALAEAEQPPYDYTDADSIYDDAGDLAQQIVDELLGNGTITERGLEVGNE